MRRNLDVQKSSASQPTGEDPPPPPPNRDLVPSTSSSVVYNRVSRVFLLFHRYCTTVEYFL